MLPFRPQCQFHFMKMTSNTLLTFHISIGHCHAEPNHPQPEHHLINFPTTLTSARFISFSSFLIRMCNASSAQAAGVRGSCAALRRSR
jgi:hypothetical protein